MAFASAICKMDCGEEKKKEKNEKIKKNKKEEKKREANIQSK